MLPLSLGRLSTPSTNRKESHDSIAWLRPANIASIRGAELRALIAGLGLFVGLGVVIALGYVWLRLEVVDLGYRVVTTRDLIEKLQQEQHALAVEAARLDSPGRLDEVARVRLGMIRPEKGQEVVLP
ncbi:MAG: septum formation initiator family protein [Candidatus Binatia bacterium]|jgi:cell division protein FtsL